MSLSEELSPEEIKAVFDVFDADQSGSIDSKELKKVLQSLGQSPTQKEIDEMMDSADNIKPDGKIDFDEFTKLLETIYKDKDSRKDGLLAAFKVFDQDGNGFITADELTNILCNMGAEQVSSEEVGELLSFCDIDGDGKISYEEFCETMASGGPPAVPAK